MKKFVSLLFIVLCTTVIVAQKTIKDPNAEKRNVNGFHAIEVSGVSIFI